MILWIKQGCAASLLNSLERGRPVFQPIKKFPINFALEFVSVISEPTDL
jgi:hypothetical protein